MLGFIPALVGCGGSQPQPKPTPKYAESLTLNKENVTLIYTEAASEEKSCVLTVTVSPSDYTQGTITWGGGKAEDGTAYVSLSPSADGKSCTVTAAKVCKDGVDVYAKIAGETEEITATCNVVVNAPKVHATAIQFNDTTARTGSIANLIKLEYTTTPAVVDDDIKVTSSNEEVATGLAIGSKHYVQVSPKGPGTTVFTIAAYDEDIKKCECKQTVTVTISEANDITVTPGQKVKTQYSGLFQGNGEWNIFKFSLEDDVTISPTNKMKITVTPKDATAPDTTAIPCFIGLTEKGKTDWILNTAYDEISYVEGPKEYNRVLKADQVYYIRIQNKAALASGNYDVHVELPAA